MKIINFFIQYLGNTINASFHINTQISEIKAFVAKQFDLTYDNALLYYDIKCLNENCTIFDYNITPNSFVLVKTL